MGEIAGLIRKTVRKVNNSDEYLGVGFQTQSSLYLSGLYLFIYHRNYRIRLLGEIFIIADTVDCWQNRKLFARCLMTDNIHIRES